MRLDAVRLRSLDERVQVRARQRTLHRVAEQPALSADDERADRILAAIVVERHFAVREERRQLRPLPERVANRFAEQTLRQHLRRKGFEPRVELRHDRRG